MRQTQRLINEPTKCYLTDRALAAIEDLKQKCKMDEDLAISCLELLWPETAIYEIPLDE